MRPQTLLLAAFLPFSVSPSHSIEADMGDTRIVLPTPPGMGALTPDIQPLYDISLDMRLPANHRLGTFIEEAAIGIALSGEVPEFERYITVESPNDLMTQSVSPRDFSTLKGIFRSDFEELIETVRGQLPELMDDMSELMSDELSVDLDYSINQIVPLSVHYETDDVLSMSMMMKGTVLGPDLNQEYVGAVTSSIVYVSGRVLAVHTYGGADDLEWTREFSKTWTDNVLSANVPAGSVGRSDGVADVVARVGAEHVTERRLAWLMFGAIVGFFSLIWSFLKGLSSEPPDIECPEFLQEPMDSHKDNPELARKLLSINDQLDVGLISEREAAERRAALVGK